MPTIQESKLSPAEDAAFESAREREFYRYWQPIARHYASPSKSPIASHDPALAAFTQFATLRLGARRSYISFFDRSCQYILSETSPSLSLDTHLAQDDRDKLWVGTGIFPRTGSTCASTARPRRAYKEKEGTLQRGANIILNLKDDDRFSEIQKICDHPHETLYVGVPIQTSRGFAIGSFCVFFDDPNRTGITDDELDFLKHLANTTMLHLEMVRAQADNLRSQDMIRGLGSFIVGGSSMNEWWLSPARASRSGSVAEDGASDLLRSPIVTENFEQNREGLSLSTASGTGHVRSVSDAMQVTSPQTTTAQEADAETNHETSDDKSSIDDSRASFPEQSRKILERASRIIVESTDVDGAVFLDASVKSFGGLVNAEDDSLSTTALDEVRTPFPHDHVQKQNYFENPVTRLQNVDDVGADPDTTSAILALSQHAEAEDLHQIEPRMTESYLRSLLKRYPHGHIWTFDEHDADTYPKTNGPTGAIGEPTGIDTITSNMLKRQTESTKDKKILQRLFPGVHSLVLVGLWDSQNSKWFAASLVWTNNPVRIFSHENELGYIAAFADSIMAEITRLQVRLSDTAKGDFISTISHELRSPLHGILGTSECLNDTNLDDYQHDLVNTLDHCGHTLLDTIDHLLDFAKINRFTKQASSRKKAVRGREDPRLTQSKSDASGTGSIEEAVDLAKITEEVIESVSAGYEHFVTGSAGTSTPGKSMKDVSLVVNIANTQSRWEVQTQVGAWRRIVLNLVGNSLKFTDKGAINVQLNSCTVDGKKDRTRVELIISDTGIGMSEQFLQNHLFSPFTQEDPHRPGTGLGLSLVHSIVTSMGGTIEIQSSKGVGTTITVSIEMTRAARTQQVTMDFSSNNATKIGHDIPICIISDAESDASNHDVHATGDNRDAALQTIAAQCQDWLGRPIKFAPGVNSSASGIYICPAQRLHMLDLLSAAGVMLAKTLSGSALIVLCDSSAVQRALRASQKFSTLFGTVEYLTQPYGPRKMAKTIALCAERLKALPGVNQPENIQPPQETAEPRVINVAPRPTTPIQIPIERPGGLARALSRAFSRQKSQTSVKSPTGDLPLRPAWATPDSALSAVQSPESSSPYTAPLINIPSIPSQEPLKPPTPPSSTSPNVPKPAETKPASTVSDPNPLHVLLVDDNPINLRLLTTYMKRAGHTYATATNGVEAIEAFKSNALASSAINTSNNENNNDDAQPFTYVLMDISMPIMDGLEATRHIRAFEREQQQPGSPRKSANIIALTGLSSEEARLEAFGSGVDLFLTKPVKLKELTGILKAEE